MDRRSKTATTLALFARVRALLLRRGQSLEDAEDLAQEALLKLEMYGRSQEVRESEAFVVRTALNLAVDAERRRRRSPISAAPLDLFDSSDSSPGPDEVASARERLQKLSTGLSRLSERTRDILLAQRLEGLSYGEIARREGISVSAVEKHMARGMAFLMDWMREP